MSAQSWINRLMNRDSSVEDGILRGETKQKILELLLGGPKSAVEIADILHIQKSAARVHLKSLQAEGCES